MCHGLCYSKRFMFSNKKKKGKKGTRKGGEKVKKIFKKGKHEKEKYRSAKREGKRFLKNFFLITRQPTVETQCIIPNDYFTYLSAECT